MWITVIPFGLWFKKIKKLTIKIGKLIIHREIWNNYSTNLFLLGFEERKTTIKHSFTVFLCLSF